MSQSRELGAQALQAGDFEGAIPHLTAAREEDPSDYMAAAYLGAALGRAGRHGEAVEVLRDAAQLQPGSDAAQHNLGVALRQAGRVDDAMAAYRQALARDPAYTRSRDALAALGAGTETVPSRGLQTAPPWPGGGPPPAAAPDSMAGQPPPWTAPGTPSAAPPPWQMPPAPQGMHVAESTAAPSLAAPSTGLRILRGIGWGLVYAQIWTVLFIFWGLVWGGAKGQLKDVDGVMLVVLFIGLAFIFGFCGSLVGLIIGAINAEEGAAVAAGVGMGLLLGLLEVWLEQNPRLFVNMIFWFFTGRMVGAGVWGRVQQPVPR